MAMITLCESERKPYLERGVPERDDLRDHIDRHVNDQGKSLVKCGKVLHIGQPRRSSEYVRPPIQKQLVLTVPLDAKDVLGLEEPLDWPAHCAL
eukprot:1673013-Pyramimonas_sp.AAC.1